MEFITVAKYISSGLLGMLVGGVMFWWVGLPSAYDKQFAVMNQTIAQMERQVSQLVSENNRLVEKNNQLALEVRGLSEQVARLQGWPIETQGD